VCAARRDGDCTALGADCDDGRRGAILLLPESEPAPSPDAPCEDIAPLAHCERVRHARRHGPEPHTQPSDGQASRLRQPPDAFTVTQQAGPVDAGIEVLGAAGEEASRVIHERDVR